MLNNPLREAYQRDAERITAEQIEALQAQRARVWNALIPASSVAYTIEPNVGVKYLHPTKGWKWVGKKRFAIRGVL